MVEERGGHRNSITESGEKMGRIDHHVDDQLSTFDVSDKHVRVLREFVKIQSETSPKGQQLVKEAADLFLQRASEAVARRNSRET